MTAGDRSRTLAIAAGLLALASGGCGPSVDTGDSHTTVPPDLIDKSFFLGSDLGSTKDDPEFWWQPTVLDPGGPAGVATLFTSGDAPQAHRIRWDVTEGLLLARTKRGPLGATGDPASACGAEDVIVAAFAISAHVDVGDDPDTSERPWFERQYVRVDWGKNLAPDCAARALPARMGLTDTVSYEPINLYVNDPNDPDAPHLDVEQGYLDVTNHLFAKPTTALVDVYPLGPGSGSLPLCALALTPAAGESDDACTNPTELAIRQSFLRVEGDLAAQEQTAGEGRAFGLSTTWGPTPSYVVNGPFALSNHHAIWERAHAFGDPDQKTGVVPCSTPETTTAAGPHRDEDGDGTEDECEAAGPGATCDTVAHACTLPIEERTARPIAWIFTEAAAEDSFDAAREAVHQWDVALRAAVMSGRYAECVRTGGAECESRFPFLAGQMDDGEDAIALAREVDDCRAGKAYSGQSCDAVADSLAAARKVTPGVLALAKEKEMAVLCHNPVESADPAACGAVRLPEGTTAAACASAASGGDDALKDLCAKAPTVRRGDLRHNQIAFVQSDKEEAPWSQLTPADDPVTGQRISSAVTVWPANIVRWSDEITRRARFIAGELPLADVTDAGFADAWLGAASAEARGTLGTLTNHELIRRASAITGVDAWGNGGVDPDALDAIDADGALRARLQQEIARVAHVRSAPVAASMNTLYSDRMASLQDTDVEAELLTSTVRALAGVGGQPLTESLLNTSSPLRGMDRRPWRTVERARDLALTEGGGCVTTAPETPVSLPVLAAILVANSAPSTRTAPPKRRRPAPNACAATSCAAWSRPLSSTRWGTHWASPTTSLPPRTPPGTPRNTGSFERRTAPRSRRASIAPPRARTAWGRAGSTLSPRASARI